MFYILSRFVASMASPVFWIVALFIVTLFIRNSRRRLVVGAIVFLLTLLLSMPTVYKRVENIWIEPVIAPFDTTQHYDYAFVPGGMTSYDTINHVIQYGEPAERIVETARLYRKGYISKLIISSDGAPNTDSIAFKKLMKETFDIKPEDILIEDKARNTMENFTFTIEKFGPMLKDKNVVVINSAMFMRRTKLCCEKTGFKSDFYSVDYDVTTYTQEGWEQYVPNIIVMEHWMDLGHEWIGYIGYLLFL